MSAFESIAERRIREAQAAGMFEDLEGAGQPIPDIDTMRPPGWWATQLAARERSKLRAEELDDDIRAAMPGLWREADVDGVRQRVAELNRSVDEYNRTTEWERRSRLNAEALVARWHSVARSRVRER